ncbi:DNA translocase FtsK 4TM domain-containing protein [Anaerobutyricum soehngenii]|uniref:DNA translocase FtsK 4TM domain-containing protein n=1 Tax=Anaerobutyricum soehngenii TaxID=105843 RepID=A0ABS3ZL50_9FIRM|nr:DNA translocase FtsK [Anaerobutyricum soehngenii]MBP0058035.1 DNA translocase FtsK 4TM domain-containing protein [Anaerobutyricum soehngenii]
MANSKTNENKTKRKTTKKTAPGSNVTRKSTAKGSTTTRKKGTTQKNSAQRNYTQRDEGIPMSNEITLVVSFGLVVLMMFSNFGHCGMIGKWLASFFFGIFGCAQFVMPVFFFLGVTILIANDYSTLAMKKCGAGFIILMEVSALSQLLYKGASITVHDLFSLAINNHVTGGIIGGGIALLLKGGFGTAGAMVILFCIFLLSCILLTQRSFVSFFKKIVKDMKTSREEWKKAAQQKQLEREAAATEDILINLDEEETPDRTKSFLKMKNGKKKTTEKRRTEQCEEKVKELEERRSQKESAREKTDKTEPKKNLQDLKVNVPLFTSSDEVKRKDCVKELHPRIYPFTEEDGKTEPFQGKLDFSAFTFPDEIKESASSFEEETNQKEKEEDVYEAPHKAKGGFHTSLPEEIKISGLKTSVKEPVENIVSEADAILEEDISVNLSDFSQSMMEAERINDEEKDKETTEYKLIDSETDNVEAMTNEVVDINNEAADNEENASEISNISDNEVIESEAKDNEIISNETVVKEIKAKEAAVPDRKKAEGKDYIFPPVTLLIKEQQTQSSGYEQYLKETALKLQQTLESFGVNVTITDISCGPSVTRYEMFPEQGTKVSKILSLTDDIKLNLAASDIRIEAPIPGKAAIGIEIPNKHNQTVHFRDLIESSTFEKFKSRLAFAVGKDIGGKTVVTDLAKMPHLLIAGATGSGKSVCINTLIMSILYKASPEEVKLIMVDPKMVELSIYNGIPHLLIPVVTDPKKASGALNWAVAEMTNRYKKFTETGVRNIEGYNKKVKELQKSGKIDPETIKKMPQIVIIIDELADLMMVAPGEVEDAIVRLSQLARAAGIHLVIATQRPSVNVITGLIKANVPSRIAFSVSSGVDSRTIIDMNGAEKLLGKGDMLFYPAGYSKPVRVQGAFISDSEISDVVEFLKENEDVAVYDTEVTEKIESKLNSAAISQEKDEYFEAAARFVIEKDKASIGMIQRMFKVGFNRAARIVDQLADAGIVGPEEGTKPRKVLMSSEQLEAYFEEYL